MGEAVTVYVGCHDFVDGADVWGCEKLDWVGQDTESTAFIDAATVKCLNNNYRQYYAMAFDEIDMCRDWCDDRASAAAPALPPAKAAKDFAAALNPATTSAWTASAGTAAPTAKNRPFTCFHACTAARPE